MDLLLKLHPKFNNFSIQNMCISAIALNEAWEFFTQIVMTAASKHIPKQTTTAQHNSLYTCLNSSIHKQIKKIYKLYYRCKSFSLSSSYINSQPINSFPISAQDHSFILTSAAEHLISTAFIDTHFDNNRLLLYMHELKHDIIKPLQAKQLLISKHKN